MRVREEILGTCKCCGKHIVIHVHEEGIVELCCTGERVGNKCPNYGACNPSTNCALESVDVVEKREKLEAILEEEILRVLECKTHCAVIMNDKTTLACLDKMASRPSMHVSFHVMNDQVYFAFVSRSLNGSTTTT